LGIGALPVAVRLSINSVGVALAGLGALVGLYAFLVSLARRGSGIGLATIAMVVCGSMLYATWMLAGGPRGLLKDLEARMAPGEPAGEPATCRELAERLRARGMDLVWSNYRDNSICIAKRGWDGPVGGIGMDKRRGPAFGPSGLGPGEYVRETGVIPRGVVVVRQWNTAAEAREAAGSKKDAFAWGRFLIYGDAELVKEIQGRL
jgi:hypothetical protein